MTVLLIGFMSSIANATLFVIIQVCAAPEMQGRVITLMNSIMHCTAPLGILIAGPVVDIFGIKFWYIVGGDGSIIIGITLMFIPAVINIEEGSVKTG